MSQPKPSVITVCMTICEEDGNLIIFAIDFQVLTVLRCISKNTEYIYYLIGIQ